METGQISNGEGVDFVAPKADVKTGDSELENNPILIKLKELKTKVEDIQRAITNAHYIEASEKLNGDELKAYNEVRTARFEEKRAAQKELEDFEASVESDPSISSELKEKIMEEFRVFSARRFAEDVWGEHSERDEALALGIVPGSKRDKIDKHNKRNSGEN